MQANQCKDTEVKCQREMESVQILQMKYIPGVFIISSLGGGPNVQREYFAVTYKFQEVIKKVVLENHFLGSPFSL